MARSKELSSETHQSILVLRNEGYSMHRVAKKIQYLRLANKKKRLR
jgi:hypothetical protein